MKEDTFTESIAHSGHQSDYEIERNKPMPNRLHGTLQGRITFQLYSRYGDKYEFPTEVSLATVPPKTPDICIYPLKDLNRDEIKAKEEDVPITTIEIISPSQSLEELTKKIRNTYFPMGVKSAWIVVPSFKAIHVMLPGDNNLYFDKGMLHDPATGIEISVDKIFERVV